jgi:hypothetical protein
MHQFLVPQFLDVEPKVIGPVTVRQFIIMMVCVGVLVLEYKLSDFGLFIILGIPTLAVFAVMAFLKVNGRPFHYFVLNIIQTTKRPGLRVWNKDMTDAELKRFLKGAKKEEATEEKPQAKFVERSRLRDLSLVVNTGGVYKTEEEIFQNSREGMEKK